MADAITLALDIFLVITYLGVSLYLAYIYFKWKETTIGIWSVGTYIATFSTFFHLLGDQGLVIENEELFKIGMLMSFVAFSVLAMAHQAARRNLIDLVLITFFSTILGAFLFLFYESVNVGDLSGSLILVRSASFSLFDGLLITYFLMLYLILVRDSEIIYQAGIRKSRKSLMRSSAISHLISWQFFVLSLIFIWFFTKISPESTIQPLLYEIPMLLLLVPILTLGSRPFDWAREGYEPKLLMLIDQQGNLAYSWTKDTNSPLLLEGSVLSSIGVMLHDMVKQSLKSMNVSFDDDTMFVKTSEGYHSVLITTGYHPSFDNLLSKIHDILVSNVDSPVEFGVARKDLPDDLYWLLKQLLPKGEI